jgi:hypothetical protein
MGNLCNLFSFGFKFEETFIIKNQHPAINDGEIAKIASGNPVFPIFNKPFETENTSLAYFFPNLPL